MQMHTRIRFEIRNASTLAAAALIVFACTNAASGQLPQTRLYAIFPPGAQAGSTVDVQVNNGADIDELTRMIFSHPGIRATQTNPGTFNNRFTVSVDQSVPAGNYEIRIGGRFGFSNPRLFQVGHRVETQEAEPNNDFEKPGTIAVGTTVNGTINGATDIDVFQFAGKKGQRLLADCEAIEIDSRLDAVVEIYNAAGRRLTRAQGTANNGPLADFVLPDDGKYFLRVFDFTFRGGVEYVYRLTLHADPHVDFIWPLAGQPNSRKTYTLYGRNLPGGIVTDWTIDKHPLQKLKIPITLPAAEGFSVGTGTDSRAASEDGFWFKFNRAQPALIQRASHPVHSEVEPNDQKSQPLQVPCSVAGFFQSKHDVDVYSFQANKGDVFSIEVFGQRAGSAADPYLIVEQITKNSAGAETAKRLTAQDDTGSNPGGKDFYMASSDPAYRFQAPAQGEYRIRVRDRYFESRGGRHMFYRLAIRKPKPDFRLITLAATPPMANNQPYTTGDITLRKGQNAKVRVLATRRDGFNGSIRVMAEGLPPGTECPAIVLGPGVTSGDLVFSTTDNATTGFFAIKIFGQSTTTDPENPLVPRHIRHQARAATVTWAGNNNLVSKSRLTNELGLSVINEVAYFQPETTIHEITVNQSRQVLLPVKLFKRNKFDNNVTFTFTGAPKNCDVQNKPIPKGKSDDVFRLFVKANAPEGVWSFYLNGAGQLSYARNPELVARAEAAVAEIVARLNSATTAEKTAMTQRDAATKAIAAATTKNKQATAAKSAADKNHQTATAAQMVAQQKQAAIAKTLAAAQKSAKLVQTVLADTKSLDDEMAKDILASLNTATTATQSAVVQATKLNTATTTALQTTTAAVATTAKALADADKKLQQSVAELKTATTQKTVAEKALAQAQADKKQATTQKATADKALAAAKKAAAPKNVNVQFPTTPIVMTIRKAPITLAAAVPAAGALKRGATIAIKCTIKRQHGFAGSVRLTLPVPPGVVGLSATSVEIPADKNDGVLSVAAAADATEGQIPNLVIRAEMNSPRPVAASQSASGSAKDIEGTAAVDAPIAIKVSK